MLMKLLQRSTDACVVRTVMQCVGPWLAAEPLVGARVAYGLTQREKQNFLTAMLTLSVPPMGLAAPSSLQVSARAHVRATPHPSRSHMPRPLRHVPHVHCM